MPPTDRSSLKIASYNLFKANYLDRPGPRGGTLREDFERLACLRAADVLLLQEAIAGTSAAGGGSGDTLQAIASALPERPIAPVTFFCGSPTSADRSWGIGVISRLPARFRSLWLPKAWWSPWRRAAVFAEIGSWVVGTMHLEVWPVGSRSRRAQMEAVLARLSEFGLDPGRPTVLAGDFNCERGGPHDQLRRAGFVPALPDGGPTFALGRLRMRLDHIYVRNACVLAAGIERGARGSDHWPVWATLEGDSS